MHSSNERCVRGGLVGGIQIPQVRPIRKLRSRRCVKRRIFVELVRWLVTITSIRLSNYTPCQFVFRLPGPRKAMIIESRFETGSIIISSLKDRIPLSTRAMARRGASLTCRREQRAQNRQDVALVVRSASRAAQ